MATTSQSVTIYTCDVCAQEMELEGQNGLTAPFPTGWLSVAPMGPQGDVFCSWDCLAKYAAERAAEKAARAAARATEGAAT